MTAKEEAEKLAEKLAIQKRQAEEVAKRAEDAVKKKAEAAEKKVENAVKKVKNVFSSHKHKKHH